MARKSSAGGSMRTRAGDVPAGTIAHASNSSMEAPISDRSTGNRMLKSSSAKTPRLTTFISTPATDAKPSSRETMRQKDSSIWLFVPPLSRRALQNRLAKLSVSRCNHWTILNSHASPNQGRSGSNPRAVRPRMSSVLPALTRDWSNRAFSIRQNAVAASAGPLEMPFFPPPSLVIDRAG